RQPIPLLGGVAVFGAWMVGMTTGVLFNQEAISSGDDFLGAAASGSSFPGALGLPLVLAASVVLISGILDDLLNLRPRWKLLGQTIAASILVAGGLVVKHLWLFGFTVDLGWLGIALTVVWLVGSMNAVN